MTDRKEVNEADLDWLAERDQPINDLVVSDCSQTYQVANKTYVCVKTINHEHRHLSAEGFTW